MPTHGALPHDRQNGCNYTKVFHRRSWAAALADDIDPIVVERLLAGEPVTCTAWERRQAVLQLRHRGWSQPQIARHLRIDKRQVNRDLERAGLTAVGQLTARKQARAHRRQVIPRLLAAGVRRRELEELFSVTETTITSDLSSLGIHHTAGLPRRPCRLRGELLVAYGHLLDYAEVAS